MQDLHGPRGRLSASGVFTMACACCALVGVVVVAAEPKAPASNAPALEVAAAALAEGRLKAAADGFAAVAQDGSQPPFVRGLAMCGIAKTAQSRGDAGEASRAWRKLADDGSLPAAFRDVAKRRIHECQLELLGLPGRDAADYRAKLPSLPKPAVEFFVAPQGDDAGDGSKAKPFRTLQRARDAVRAWKKSHGKLPDGGATVWLRAGRYAAGATLRLAAEDSGTAAAPIVYRAESASAAVLRGGVDLVEWKPVAEAAVLERLDQAVRGKVLQANLARLGVTDFGDATDLRRSPELFCGGVPQTLARWPNEGFIKTGEVLGRDTFKVWNTIPGCKDGKFRYSDERLSRWADEPDARLYGYWFWDWFEEYQKVASIDAASRTVTLTPPYAQYGYRKDQRFYGVNILRELDRPGEWYLDRRRGTVYWLPPAGYDPSRMPTTLSVRSEPFISIEDASHVMFLGLVFEEGRGDGLRVRGGSDCLIAGCTLRRLGGDAIVIEGGLRHGVFGCTMHTLGCGGVRAAGGDRATLTPGGHFIENCTVENISRLKRTYTPAVLLDGCGNRVAHNDFSHIPSSALRIEGNNQLIELNLIRHVVEESDDQGGLDIFGNPLYRGVVIRWNRWQDIGGGTHCGAAGVRLDDMISGVAIYGNLFERCGAVQFGGVQIHGGKDNLVDGNVFVDCFAGVTFSRWGAARWLEGIASFLPQANSPPYKAAYPELARIKVDADVNFICRNAFVRCKDVFLRDGGVARTSLNAAIDAAAEAGDIPAIVSDAKAIARHTRLRKTLLEPIPIDEIGPYAHPWRAERKKGRWGKRR